MREYHTVKVNKLSLYCPNVNDSGWDLLSFCSSYPSVPAWVYNSAQRVGLNIPIAGRSMAFAGPDGTSMLRMSMRTRSEEHLNDVLTQRNHHARLHKHVVCWDARISVAVPQCGKRSLHIPVFDGRSKLLTMRHLKTVICYLI